MEYSQFYEEFGTPFTGRKKKKVQEFLKSMQLQYDEGVEYTVNLTTQDGEIAATGSLQQNVIKGLSSRVVTLLLNHASEVGQQHLFVFTKPKNRAMFSDLGFFPIIETADVLLMENVRDGIKQYVQNLERPKGNPKTIGAIVANCNPFTNGHRYLIETATSQCDVLHLFVLSEDRSVFPASVRYQLVKEGIRGLENVILHHTSDYLISSAVFPTYFITEQKQSTVSLTCASSANILQRNWVSQRDLSAPSRSAR